MGCTRGRLSFVVAALLIGVSPLLTFAQDRIGIATPSAELEIAETSIPQDIESLLQSMRSASSRDRSQAIVGLREFGMEAQLYAARLLNSGEATPEQRDGLMIFLVSESRRGGRERSLQATIILDQLTQSANYALAGAARKALGPDVTTAKSCSGTTICRKTLVSVSPAESYVSYTGYDWIPGKRRPKREYQRIRVWLTESTVTIDGESRGRNLRTEIGPDEFSSQFPSIAARVAYELEMHQHRNRKERKPSDALESASLHASQVEDHPRRLGDW